MPQKGKQTTLGELGSNFVVEARSQNTACHFCSIARREVSAFEVFRNRISVSFLDKRPVFFGHCLLIPLDHFETLYELPGNLVGPLFETAQRIGRGIQTAMASDGTLILINNKVSQSVSHLHIHIIPRKVGDHLRGFMWPRLKYKSEEQMKEIAGSITDTIRKVSPSLED